VNLGLEGRVALVCGSSAGIGLGIAEALAEEGANVVLFARRADELERQAERLGGLAVPGDVRVAEDAERLVRTAAERFRRIDILVNNSGGPPRSTALEASEDDVREAVDLLLVSVVRLTSLCLPYLRESPAGRVVNVASSTVREPASDLVLSNAVRPGVIGWAKTLSREVGPNGITVNSIAPGWIDTQRIREVNPGGPTEEELRAVPLRRLGEPRELGDLVAFLCSDRAAYITGTVIPVDGGLLRGLG
jgi:3-oxoacyl-[acyl-carrier protein] reductase